MSNKIICPLMMCQHNSSYKAGKPGECLNSGLVELKVKDIHEISGFEDFVPCELEDEELMECNSFIHSEIKAKKIEEEK